MRANPSLTLAMLTDRAGPLAALSGGLCSWGHADWPYGLEASKPDVPYQLEWRITEEVGPNGLEKWFEVGICADDELSLTGRPECGWVDGTGKIRVCIQQSETLTEWYHGKFIPCIGSPSNDGGGSHTFWARSIYPVASSVKTGDISSGNVTYDPRMNPFTALTLGGVVQDLPNFPYTMPGDSAQMQTDLRAIGWSGATVSATSDVLWIISIPSISQEASNLSSKVFWPMFLVPDMYGNIVNPCDGRDLSGTWVNAAGVRTEVTPQFARLEITTLKS